MHPCSNPLGKPNALVAAIGNTVWKPRAHGHGRMNLDSGELIIPSPDVNSMYDCGDIGDGPEMDDTSLSSRASSRIFDSDQIYSAESMHGGM